MKKSTLFLIIFCCLIFTGSQAQTAFTPGNIVVFRAGDGITNYTVFNAAPVFLDEYTPSGVLVQSVVMPTMPSSTNHMLTHLIGGIDGCWLTLSVNKEFLVLTGFDAVPGTPGPHQTTSTAVPRVIGLVKYDGTINTSTALTDYASEGTPHSAVSTNGTDLWAVSATSTVTATIGTRYTTIGSSTSVQINNAQPTDLNALTIAAGQLYVSTFSGATSVRLGKVGNGLPITSGQTITGLPGFPTGSGNVPYQFVFADLDGGIAGVDVLYVADEFTRALTKYSFNGVTWVSRGTVGDNLDDYRGLTASVSGTTVTLYAIRGGSELVSLTDASGRTGTLTGTPTVIASTANGLMSFGGVALAPQGPLAIKVKAFLQGAYNSGVGRHKDVTTTWANVLNSSALSQPYNAAPFNYTGTESVTNNFFTSTAATTDVVDWVLVELRDAANPATLVARKAAFIREDGRIVDLNGTSDVSFPGVVDGNYYIVIRHRNHLSVRTATPQALSSTATLYDFTTAQNNAYQNGTITTNGAMTNNDLSGATTTAYLMWGGNANGDNLIRASAGANVNDYLTLMSPTNLNGNTSTILSNVYRSVDMNLDGLLRASAGANVNDYLVLMSPGILNGNTSNIISGHL